jgi:hypothetical protein
MRVWLREQPTLCGSVVDLDGDVAEVLFSDGATVELQTCDLILPVPYRGSDQSHAKVEWLSLEEAIFNQLVGVDAAGDLVLR